MIRKKLNKAFLEAVKIKRILDASKDGETSIDKYDLKNAIALLSYNPELTELYDRLVKMGDREKENRKLMISEKLDNIEPSVKSLDIEQARVLVDEVLSDDPSNKNAFQWKESLVKRSGNFILTHSKTRYFLFTKPLIIIGREDTGFIPDVSIKSNWISRKHAELRRENSSFILTDLGSSNGTYVNNERVVNRILENGDEVSMSKEIFFKVCIRSVNGSLFCRLEGDELSVVIYGTAACVYLQQTEEPLFFIDGVTVIGDGQILKEGVINIKGLDLNSKELK